jgi:hypothetical protein
MSSGIGLTKLLDWKLHWILIIVSSAYKHATNVGTPESHARNYGDAESFSILPNGSQKGAEIKTIQEKMDDGQEEMKAQVGCLASQIDANQKEIKATFDACLEKM